MSGQSRIILHINEGSDGILALRAARALSRDGHRSCVYSYENGVSIYAYHTMTGVAAREEGKSTITSPIDARIEGEER